MSGTRITVDKNGGCHALHTADGVEIEGVMCTSLQLTQTKGEKAIGFVRVQFEMFVYEKDLQTTGKFNATDFIRKKRQ
jgi:hypothetical protein